MNLEVAGAVRALTEAEMESITGGDQPKTLGTITVTAGAFSVSLGSAFGGSSGGGGKGGEHHDSESPISDDFDSVEIQNELGREFTEEEKAAIQALAEAIASMSQAISALPNSAVITLPYGNTITGAELKAIWGELDFTINTNGTLYGGQPQGSGVDVYGRQVGVDVGHLTNYAALGAEGMNYFVLHEVAHMTSGAIGMMNYFNIGGWNDEQTSHFERYTNNVALAIGNATGHTLLSNPGWGYGD